MISWTRTWPDLAACWAQPPSAGQACPGEMCCQLSRLLAKEDLRDMDIVCSGCLTRTLRRTQ